MRARIVPFVGQDCELRLYSSPVLSTQENTVLPVNAATFIVLNDNSRSSQSIVLPRLRPSTFDGPKLMHLVNQTNNLLTIRVPEGVWFG